MRMRCRRSLGACHGVTLALLCWSVAAELVEVDSDQFATIPQKPFVSVASWDLPGISVAPTTALPAPSAALLRYLSPTSRSQLLERFRNKQGTHGSAATAAAGAPLLPSTAATEATSATSSGAATALPITSAVCRLDAKGNVADVVFYNSQGATGKGCSSSNPPSGQQSAREVLLDFSDSLIVQVVQGKLSADPRAAVAWLGFKTDSGVDMRTCGFNVQPSSATAAMQPWTATNRSALSNVSTSCGSNVVNATQSQQLLGLTFVTFGAPLPAVKSLGFGLPPSCTSAWTLPPVNVSDTDDTDCLFFFFDNRDAAKPSAHPICPTATSPGQWVQPITRQQLPAARPPAWEYRDVSTAVATVVSLLTPSGNTITATVQHAPVPNVTSAMVHWWFNGNVEGEMLLNGVVYPRYLVWHPRDHVRQSTLIPGPKKGSATGAFWSIIEFMDARPSGGYTKSSSNSRASWSRSYIANNNIQVYLLDSNTLDMRVQRGDYTPFRLLHTWADTTDDSGQPSLVINSTLALGIDPLVPDNELAAGLGNPIAFKQFGGNCARGAAEAWVKHTVEEVGNFQFFLPQLYSLYQ